MHRMQGTKRGIYISYPYSTAILVKKQNIIAGKTESHSVITEGAKSKQNLFYSNIPPQTQGGGLGDKHCTLSLP